MGFGAGESLKRSAPDLVDEYNDDEEEPFYKSVQDLLVPPELKKDVKEREAALKNAENLAEKLTQEAQRQRQLELNARRMEVENSMLAMYYVSSSGAGSSSMDVSGDDQESEGPRAPPPLSTSAFADEDTQNYAQIGNIGAGLSILQGFGSTAGDGNAAAEEARRVVGRARERSSAAQKAAREQAIYRDALKRIPLRSSDQAQRDAQIQNLSTLNEASGGEGANAQQDLQGQNEFVDRVAEDKRTRTNAYAQLIEKERAAVEEEFQAVEREDAAAASPLQLAGEAMEEDTPPLAPAVPGLAELSGSEAAGAMPLAVATNTGLTKSMDAAVEVLSEEMFKTLDATSTENIEEAGGKDSQELWRRWIHHIRNLRKSNPRAFFRARDLQEDLLFGPQDGARLYHAGFKRHGPNALGKQKNEIYWYIRQPAGSGSKRELKDPVDILAMLKSNPNLLFFPDRIPGKTTHRRMRDLKPLQAQQQPGEGNKATSAFAGGAFRSKVDRLGIVEKQAVDDDGGGGEFAATVAIDPKFQGNLKYARDERRRIVMIDGQPKIVERNREVRHVTKNIRIVWIPIRLNEAHWEACYWRELKNLKMFEPASMTPYLHNKEFGTTIGQMEFSNSAVPLLTNGSMNFYGVDLGEAGEKADLAEIAIADWGSCNKEEVTARCVPLTFDSVGVKSFTHVLTKLETDLEGKLRGGSRDTTRFELEIEIIVDRKPTKIQAIAATKGAGGGNELVAFFVEKDGNRPTWRTVFRIGPYNPEAKEPPSNQYFQNYYAVPAASVLGKFGVDGYKNPKDTKRQSNPHHVPAPFLGRPIFKMKGKGTSSVQGDRIAGGADRDGQAELLDVRICSYKYKRLKDAPDYVASSEDGKEPTQRTSVNSSHNKWYSEYYREQMWQPQALTSLRTLPEKNARFRDAVDKNPYDDVAQMPAYLNMHHDRLNAEKRPQGTAATEDLGMDYAMKFPPKENASADEWEKWKKWYNETRKVPPRGGATWFQSGLGQRYPETVLSREGDMDARAGVMHTLFNSTKKDSRAQRLAKSGEFEWFTQNAGKFELKQWRSKSDLTSEQQTERMAEWRENFNKSNYTRLLAPTTLKDAVRRYVLENSTAMQWYAPPKEETHDVKVALNVSPDGVDAPAGVYFSCRFDLGGEKGTGGLDALFPCSKDANVYTIADVMLARGMHDYLREKTPQAADDKRAGAPHWWKAEQDYLREKTPQAADDKRAGAPHWWKAEQSLQPQKREVMNKSRMDKAAAWPYRPPRPNQHAPPDTNETLKARLRFANGFTSADPGNSYSFGSLVFNNTFNFANAYRNTNDKQWRDAVPPPRPALNKLGGDGGGAAIVTLPHTHDLSMPRFPIYFHRLSNYSQTAVWKRWMHNEAVKAQGQPIEIVKPKLAGAIGNFERLIPGTIAKGESGYRPYRNEAYDLLTTAGVVSGAEGETTSTEIDSERLVGENADTLVAPCYIVALDYDDFMQAVNKVEEDWNAFFKDHTKYLKKADMYRLQERVEEDNTVTHFLVYNDKYKLPSETVPPRLPGSWATFDGPPEVQDADTGTWRVPDNKKLSVRPIERTLESWIADKKLFGDRKPDATDSTAVDNREKFKSFVDTWEKAYDRYWIDRQEYVDLDAMEKNLSYASNQLEYHSWSLAINLGRMLETPTLENLFAEDESILPGDRIGRKENKAKLITDWEKRLPLVIFVLDTVQYAEKVRTNLAYYRYIHSLLDKKGAGNEYRNSIQAKVDASAKTSDPYLYIADLLTRDEFNWTTEAEIDGGMKIAARTLTRTLQKLAALEDQQVWRHICSVAKSLLMADFFSATAEPTAGEDPMSTEASLKRLKEDLDAPAYVRRYGTRETTLAIFQWLLTAQISSSARGWNLPDDAEIEEFPVEWMVKLLGNVEDDDDDAYHLLQARMQPVMLAICDAWIDYLLQLHIREQAYHFVYEKQDDRADEDVQQVYRAINADRYDMQDKDEDNAKEMKKTLAPLRPAAMRVPRDPPLFEKSLIISGDWLSIDPGPRDGGNDLASLAKLVNYPTALGQTAYYKEIQVSWNLAVQNHEKYKTKRRLLNLLPDALPFDTDEALLASTAGVFGRVFSLLNQDGSAAQTLFKLMSSNTEDEALSVSGANPLLQLKQTIDGLVEKRKTSKEFASMPRIVLVAAEVLKATFEKKESLEDKNERERLRKAQLQKQRHERRIRSMRQTTKILYRTMMHAKDQIEVIRAQKDKVLETIADSNEKAGSAASFDASITQLTAASKQAESLYKTAYKLANWLLDQKNYEKMDELEKNIRAKIKQEKEEEKKMQQESKKQRQSSSEAGEAGPSEQPVEEEDLGGMSPLQAVGHYEHAGLEAQGDQDMTEAGNEMEVDDEASSEDNVRLQTSWDYAHSNPGSFAYEEEEEVDGELSQLWDDVVVPLMTVPTVEGGANSGQVQNGAASVAHNTNATVQSCSLDLHYTKNAVMEISYPGEEFSFAEEEAELMATDSVLTGKSSAVDVLNEKKEATRLLNEFLDKSSEKMRNKTLWETLINRLDAALQSAQVDELVIIEKLQWRFRRQRAFLALHAYLATRSADVDELNAALQNDAKNATNAEDDAEDDDYYQQWERRSYHQYIANQLNVRIDAKNNAEVWFFETAPMTLEQWRRSPLGAGAMYPYDDAPTKTEVVVETEDATSSTQEERVDAALANAGLASNGPLRAQLLKLLTQQSEIMQAGKVHGPVVYYA